jgi:hypothetical protein
MEDRMYCPRCGLGQSTDHQFCIQCGVRLPTELLPPDAPKVSRWFRAIPVHPEDRPETMLRVSRYLKEFDIETAEGSVRIPAHHVRFSVWAGDQALAAVSIPDDEARALSGFLAAAVDGAQEQDPSSTSPAG